MEKKTLSIYIHICKLNTNFLFSLLNNEDTAGDKRKEKLALAFFF